MNIDVDIVQNMSFVMEMTIKINYNLYFISLAFI